MAGDRAFASYKGCIIGRAPAANDDLAAGRDFGMIGSQRTAVRDIVADGGLLSPVDICLLSGAICTGRVRNGARKILTEIYVCPIRAC